MQQSYSSKCASQENPLWINEMMWINESTLCNKFQKKDCKNQSRDVIRDPMHAQSTRGHVLCQSCQINCAWFSPSMYKQSKTTFSINKLNCLPVQKPQAICRNNHCREIKRTLIQYHQYSLYINFTNINVSTSHLTNRRATFTLFAWLCYFMSFHSAVPPSVINSDENY